MYKVAGHELKSLSCLVDCKGKYSVLTFTNRQSEWHLLSFHGCYRVFGIQTHGDDLSTH